jgi:hypothetical protein
MALFLAVAAPAMGTPEWTNRVTAMHRTEYPVVSKLVDAARKGNQSDFHRYVAEGATFASASQPAVPFTVNTIRGLASRCTAGDKVGMRLLDESDELSIYWQCPAGSSSPMTTLTFRNGKIVHAETGTAVVHALAAPEKGAN